MKKCSRCAELKALSEFNQNKAKHDGLQTICRECMKIVRKAHYEANKKELIQKNNARRQMLRDKLWSYKQGMKCFDCGERNPKVFEFDHTSNDKLENISSMISRGFSWESILVEINKCDIVCANCHRIRTHDRGGWVRNITIEV